MTVVLIRHAVAVARGKWDGDDARRSLTPRGRRQAGALVDALAQWPVARIVSSPSLRCRETVQALADASSTKVRTSRRLAEGKGDDALDLVLDAVDDVALCTHGDVTLHVLQELRRLGWDVPTPIRNQKGGAWVLVAGRRVVHLPPGR